MCGIAGYLGPDIAGLAAMCAGMARAMDHRGPDDEGTEILRIPRAPDRTVALVHRRLSIIDLSPLGHQPMHDPATGNWIVYNGEIYNFKSLREDYRREGATFTSQTDTEVLLAGYALRGEAVLDELCGMFSLALWDAQREQLFLAVDPLGIKPLYYYAGAQDELVFASEMRTLLGTGRVARRVDPVGLEGYLSYGAVQGPNTIIEGVRLLPPGHAMVIAADGAVRGPRPFWTPAFAESEQRAGSRRDDGAGQAAAAEIGALLEQAVDEHLYSDVPTGAFLSGGIDSSALVALASRGDRELRTFSVTFAEAEFSEAPFSREVAQRFGSTHQEICLSERDLLDRLPTALDALDQPTLDGMNVYVISQAVREAGITVVLSGQGGDEVFGGYPTFRQVDIASRWRARLGLVPDACWRAAGRVWNGVQSRRRAIPDKLGQFLGEDGGPFTTYLLLRQLFPPSVRREIFPDGGPGTSREGLPEATAAALREACRPLDAVNQVSLLELRTYLGNMLLRDSDVMSMSHSLELRVPFLDRRVVEYVARLPGRLKMDRDLPKPLLLGALGGRVPECVYRRRKQGFTFPWPSWLRQELRPLADEALGDRATFRRLGVDPAAPERLWRDFLRGSSGLSWSRIWSLVVLREWAVRHRVELS